MTKYYKNPSGQAVVVPGENGETVYVTIADDNTIYLDLIAAGHEVLDYVPPTPLVTEVSPYQARKALKDAGVLTSVLALMASLDETDDARMAWEYATVIHRTSPFINTLGSSLGLTSKQIDGLFLAASQVT
jgi:hypothetical protein